MQGNESTIDDPQQPRQGFYGGQNITYNGLQGSHLSPSATAHHSSSHNVNPTTRAQQLYAAAINASLGTSPPVSPRSTLSSGSLPTSPTTLSLSPTAPYTPPGTQIMSGMYQPRPSSPTSQIYYHQHQRGSSSSLPSEATRDSFQGQVAMDNNAGSQQSSVYTQSFPQPQHAQTATSNMDTFENSTTQSSASFYAGLSQISVASLPVQQSHDSLIVGHAAHETKALSGKLGKVSKNIAKFALRVAGSAVQITTGVHVPTEAIVGFMDGVANLINRFASHDQNLPDISRDDLEAVFQGAPNAKYEEVIQALLTAQAQQQKAPGTAPAFNIRALIDELGRLQALANAQQVHVFQSQAYPSFGQMGVLGQSGSMMPALMNNAQPMQSQTQPNVLLTHAPGALMIREPAVYAPGPSVEPNPPHILRAPSPSQFHSRSSLIDPSVSFPTHQMHITSSARLYGDISGATNRLRSDDLDVSNDRDARSARLPPEFMQQQAQLQTTLRQQQQQMTLLQQQQQQLVQILLEQQKHKQEIREEKTSSPDFSTRASVGSRPDSGNEVTSLPLPLT